MLMRLNFTPHLYRASHLEEYQQYPSRHSKRSDEKMEDEQGSLESVKVNRPTKGKNISDPELDLLSKPVHLLVQSTVFNIPVPR